MNTSLKFLARAARGTDRHLQLELLRLGIRAKFQPGLKSFQFRARLPEMLSVCFKSRVIEQMDVQVGQKFQARDIHELGLSLRKIPLNGFWDVGALRLPRLKVKVDNSVMSDRVVGKIFREHVERLPVARELTRMQLDQKGLSTLADVHEIIKKQVADAMNPDNDQKMLPNQSIVQTGSKQIAPLDADQVEFKLHMDKNYGRIYTPVNAVPMYKHGWKRRVGWGPIKESLAAAILQSAGIIDKVRTGQTVKLWDPFCGSGTFLLEALSVIYQLPVRQDAQSNFHFLKWPCFKQQYLDEYIKSQPQQLNSAPISIIGSDISLQAVNYSIQNYKRLNLPSQTESLQSINFDASCSIFKANKNIYFIADDFQKVGEKLIKGNGYTIITNPPHGLRSKQTIQLNQLKSIYKRFSEFIKSNYEKLDQVFVIVPIEQKYSSNHFLTVSDLRWTLVDRFYSGPVQIGLYGLADKSKSIVSSVSKINLPEIHKKQQTSLEFPRSEAAPTPPAHVAFPGHLIPKRPKNIKKRVLWRRKVHELKESYERHMKKRYALQSIQAFHKDKLMWKLRQRGKVWKSQNLGMLEGKPEEYEEGVRKLFQERIVNALEKRQEAKKAKQQKKERSRKRDDIKVKRKW